MIKDSDGRVMMSDDPGIWKPIPVRTFYTFVIYYGYDMDILSGKSYDVVYLDYTLQMICISQMQIIYNGISLSYIFLLLEKYFKISYTEDIQITNILECHMYGISKSQIFLNVICMGCLNHKYLYPGYSMDILSSQPRAGTPRAFRALLLLLNRVATALVTQSFATAMCRSSVSATDRPSRRCLPCPIVPSKGCRVITTRPQDCPGTR